MPWLKYRKRGGSADHDVLFRVPGAGVLLLGDGGNEEKRADSADEHQNAKNKSAGGAEFRGYSHRKSAGRISADHFEKNAEEGHHTRGAIRLSMKFRDEQKRRADDDNEHADDEKPDRLIHGIFRNGAAHHLHSPPPEKTVEAENGIQLIHLALFQKLHPLK